jgi:hypothetical protein
MKVYAAGPRQAQGTQTLHIAPAAHVGDQAAPPVDWLNDDGSARNFTITFVNGEAEVTDEIGRYLLAYKMARRSRLILPADLAA